MSENIQINITNDILIFQILYSSNAFIPPLNILLINDKFVFIN